MFQRREDRTTRSRRSPKTLPQREWFQVIRFPASLPTGMPGWSFGNQDCETLSSQLHAPLLCRKAPQRIEARLRLRPIWSRRLDAAFRSLTAAACFQTAAARSTLPACLFDVTLELSSNPFDLPLRCSLRFAPERAGSIRQTRCPTLFRRSPRLPNLHSPQGMFYVPC
jgi:hypothetical protein